MLERAYTYTNMHRILIKPIEKAKQWGRKKQMTKKTHEKKQEGKDDDEDDDDEDEDEEWWLQIMVKYKK